ncbi:MAG: DUF5940 domain-containing protein [Firmicutes bacterium]|nr:DUF5940 domain-containing protein [Bacillota bacterium]
MAAIHGIAYILAHVPDLVRYGSKPYREAVQNPTWLEVFEPHLRTSEAARSYLPHQVFIGAESPEVLKATPRPWHRHLAEPVSRGRWGWIIEEPLVYALLRAADVAQLVWLEPSFEDQARDLLASHPLTQALTWSQPAPRPRGPNEVGGVLPLQWGNRLVGAVRGDHQTDEALTAGVLLENLLSKVTGYLAIQALRALLPDYPWGALPYLIGTGEEAIGDRYQRGGGNLAKAVAHMASLQQATGCDVKAFCAAPIHAIPIAAGLVDSGIYPHVVLFGGGCLAKLGMKVLSHLRADMPILEDVLGAFAMWVGPDQPGTAHIRREAVGRHPVGAGAQPQAIYEALVADPLRRVGLTMRDIDRFGVEMHNPDITEPAGGGDIPRTNYRTLAALSIYHGEASRHELDALVDRWSYPGFSPTQGHVAAAVPALGWILEEFRNHGAGRAMLVAKGSLFLGRMTPQSDGSSVLLEAQ